MFLALPYVMIIVLLSDLVRSVV